MTFAVSNGRVTDITFGYSSNGCSGVKTLKNLSLFIAPNLKDLSRTPRFSYVSGVFEAHFFLPVERIIPVQHGRDWVRDVRRLRHRRPLCAPKLDCGQAVGSNWPADKKSQAGAISLALLSSSHSYLRATLGSTAEARRAGT